MRKGVKHEFLVFVFLLGLLLLNPPILSIFNVPDYVAGVPVLYVYLFAVWAILIALMALTTSKPDHSDDAPDIAEEATAEDESA